MMRNRSRHRGGASAVAAVRRIALSLAMVVPLASSCSAGAPEVRPPDSGHPVSSASILLGSQGRQEVRIDDPVGDVFDHEGTLKGPRGVDLVRVVVTADRSGLTVAFTCAGSIPRTSGRGMYLGTRDAMFWEVDAWFTGDPDDARRHMQLRVGLIGTEWQGQVAIFVGPNKGLFKLTEAPRRKGNRITLTVPWDEPVTATKVNGEDVFPPRPNSPIFVAAGTKWDHYVSPDDEFGSANGGDKAPDEGARVELGS